LAANPGIPASTDGKPAIPAHTIPWWTLPGGPMDAAGNQHNGRFAIVFGDDAPDPDLDDAANLARIRRVIRDWRPAKALCAAIHVVSGGHYYGEPGVEWGADQWNGTGTIYTAE